jgi:hypothetical protein
VFQNGGAYVIIDGKALRAARSDVAHIGSEIDAAPSRPLVPSRVIRRARSPEQDRKTTLFWRTIWRISLPAIALFAALALMYLYRGEPATFADELLTGSSAWLSLGALCVPLTFLAVHLANRRYGPAIAAGQVFTAWFAVAVAAIVYPVTPAFDLTGGDPTRIGLALPVSLLLAHFVAIVSFDAARSIRWWKAPLNGSVAASVVFTLTFFPAAYLGSDGPWFSHMTEYLAVALALSVAALAVYWVARPMVRPLPGLAGY